jgi:predicted RNase H-related nuclease YkuK (DUF458 family)
MFTNNQINEIVELLIQCDKNTKVYLGCDSIRYFVNNETWARYATVAIIHKNGKNGCRIFSNISKQRDFDPKPNKPRMRMLNEVQNVCNLYLQLKPFISEFNIEIHLDINTDPKHGSSCVVNEAAGYVLGMTGVEPKYKPDSWAASFGADGVVHGRMGK